MLQITIEDNRLVILTNDPGLHYFLETKQSSYQYIPWKKEWGYVDKVVKIYDAGRHSVGGGYYRYVVGKGWATYLLGIFKDRLSVENYNEILTNVVMADSYRTIPFKELRDYQNDDVLFLMKYRIGLMVVNTGYGAERMPHYANYIVKHRAKTVKAEMLIPC